MYFFFISGLPTADLNAIGNDAVRKTQINNTNNKNYIGNGSNIHVVLFILDNNTLISSTVVCLK